MIETCCEAVSVSICHFVTWLLIFILSFLSAAPSLCSFFFFLFSLLFLSNVSLFPSSCLFLSQICYSLPLPKLHDCYEFQAPLHPYYIVTDRQLSPLLIHHNVFVTNTLMSFQGLHNAHMRAQSFSLSAHFETIPSSFLCFLLQLSSLIS